MNLKPSPENPHYQRVYRTQALKEILLKIKSELRQQETPNIKSVIQRGMGQLKAIPAQPTISKFYLQHQV